ncbi:MAG: hypothetical protein L6Q29_03555 [Candidatus Pacebacteria bacterium]|nr:hypothetical protein [Candidatus Paceibacterota bacterium]
MENTQENSNTTGFAIGVWQDENKATLGNFKGGEVQSLTFYKLNSDGSYEDGTTLEELLRVGIERLKNLNSRFNCRENSIAITKMEEALMWLNARTADRMKRGVEGKHQA